MSQNSMETKYVSLSEVSNKFTEEVLKNILSEIYGGKEVQLVDWSFEIGSAKGDNYLSNIYKGKLNGIIDGEHLQANIVVKSIPKSAGVRKTLKSVESFRNEIAFYTKIISKFEKFLADKGQSDLLCIPRHIISFADTENDFIVLEDISCLGFHTASRHNYLKWTECTAILKTLANFHAISFAYKDQKKKEFAEIANVLEEIFYGSEHWDWYKGFHEKLQVIIKHALTAVYPNSKAEQQYNSYKFGTLFNKSSELCARRFASTSVITQGDCWAPNFLIRDIGQNQQKALMLDFQLARCASPVLDLSFLIYSCTVKPFRDQYFDDILKVYHSELSSAIKSLGSDPEDIYPWDIFMKEVKEQFVFGIFISLENLPFALMDASQVFDLSTLIKGDEAIDLGELIRFSHIANASGRQRIADVIVDGIEKGFI